MSQEHYDLEVLALAHITKSTKSMDKLLSKNITKDHFNYIAEGETVSYTKGIFDLILKYYQSSGGSLFTSYVLGQKLNDP